MAYCASRVWGRFVGIASTVLVIVLNYSWAVALRSLVQGGLEKAVLSPRRWHAYVRWKSELFFVSVLAIVLAQTMRWYVLACVVTAVTYLLDLLSRKSTNADDQVGCASSGSPPAWLMAGS